MARWKLLQPHYLNVAGNQWQHKEVNRITGRPKIINFDVPMFLHPDDSSNWTIKYNQDAGDIIVSDGNNPAETDIIFSGDPTPDMEPLDDDAKAISAKYTDRWSHPINDLPATGGDRPYAEKFLEQWQAQMAEIQAGMVPNQAAPGVSVEAFTELQQSVKSLLEQNAQLLQTLVSAPARRL